VKQFELTAHSALFLHRLLLVDTVCGNKLDIVCTLVCSLKLQNSEGNLTIVETWKCQRFFFCEIWRSKMIEIRNDGIASYPTLFANPAHHRHGRINLCTSNDV
jgi:hypothetical protein